MRLATILASVSLSVGCFHKPDPPGVAGDANGIMGDGSGSCSGASFAGLPVELPGLTGSVGDPAIRADLLEIFFTYDPGGLYYELRSATRGTPSAPFVQRTSALPFSGGAATDYDPSISADGNTLVFISDRTAGEFRGYLVTRSGATWGTAVPMPGLTTMRMQSMFLSTDAKTLYFNDFNNTLHIATATAAGGPYVDAATTFGTDISYPTFSADGKEAYYANGMGIVHSVRPDLNAPFVGGTNTGINYRDPDLTPDGLTLVFYDNNGGAASMTRCATQ